MALGTGAHSILTTNYDYNFENSADKPFGSTLTKERKYSIFRRKCIEDFCIWHIHGESDHPNTLVLGHDHYSDYIDQMQEYVNKYQNMKLKNWKKNINTNNNWVTLFLESDVHILGLGFDYTEVDLWWLISKKERFHLQGIDVGKTYYYPVDPKPSTRKIAKYSILESFGVNLMDNLRGKDYRDSYLYSLDYIQKQQD